MYAVPGWRIGWVIIHDRHNLFSEVRGALVKLSQLILGANTLAQSVIATALHNTDPSYYENLNKTLHKHAKILTERLSKVPGLTVVEPQGAMYMMVHIYLLWLYNFELTLPYPCYEGWHQP